MSTFIGVESTVTYGTDSRAWLWGPHGTEPGTTPSIVLDISSFTAATHYPNGQIPSGTVLGKITASGLYGPYDNAATDGRQTAAGLLFSFVVPKADTTKDIGGAMLVHGFVNPAKLPFASGAGALDAAARVELPLIYFA